MNIIRYSDKEIELLKRMLGQTVQRITYSITQIRIDFRDFSVQFDISVDNAVSSVGGAEIKRTKPVLSTGESPNAHESDSMEINLPVDEIEIMETMLYWRAINKSEVEPLNTGNQNLNRVANNLLNRSVMATEEILIKPSLLRNFFFPGDFLNRVDVGIRIKSGPNYFVIAPIDNFYGFREKSWIPKEDYKKTIRSSYRYKKLNHH